MPGLEAGKLNGSLVIGVSFHRGSRHATREKWKSATKKVRVSQVSDTESAPLYINLSEYCSQTIFSSCLVVDFKLF